MSTIVTGTLGINVMDNWRKIEDTRPKDGQEVIYFFDVVGVHRGIYREVQQPSDFYGKEFDTGSPVIVDVFYSAKGFLSDDVTHWMPDNDQPLPDPPVIIN